MTPETRIGELERQLHTQRQLILHAQAEFNRVNRMLTQAQVECDQLRDQRDEARHRVYILEGKSEGSSHDQPRNPYDPGKSAALCFAKYALLPVLMVLLSSFPIVHIVLLSPRRSKVYDTSLNNCDCSMISC